MANITQIATEGIETAKRLSRYLHDKISELKNPSKVRIYWTGDGKGRIILLNGADKTGTKSDQDGQIDRAVKWLAELRAE